jgi:Tfp pilus assembly protein PilF
MVRKTGWVVVFTVFIGTVLLSGCGPKPRPAEGLLDTPDSHTNQGMRKFEEGNLDAAQAEFEQALSLDAKYAPAHAGLSLVYAVRAAQIADNKSKERKNYRKQGEKHLNKAVDLNDKDPSVWIAGIRYYTILHEGDDWIKKCEKRFEKALKLNPQSDEAYYFMGLAYKQALDFDRAQDMLTKALDIDGAWSEKADAALKMVHKIIEAQPGTKYGKLIALQEKISRADMAVLFIEELNIVQRIERREMAKSMPDLSFKAENPQAYGKTSPPDRYEITDIKGHWAESMIRDFVKTGLFEVSQDHKFYPDKPVTRIEFAGVVQRLMYMVTGDESIFTKYIGEKQSHIRDMRPDHPFYGAAVLCVERGIMDLDKITGYFRPEETVSGPDALLFIRDLKNALKW